LGYREVSRTSAACSKKVGSSGNPPDGTIMSNSCWCIENAVPVFNAIAYDLGGGSIVLLKEVILLVVLLLIVFIFFLLRSRITSSISFLPHHHHVVLKCMFLWDPPIVSVAIASFLWSTFPLVYLQVILVWLMSNPQDQQ
jgi:hypothetical protein